MKVRAFGLSDVGRCREKNQDYWLLDGAAGIYAVADGMGGHAAGEVASHLAIESLAESIAKSHADGQDGIEIERASVLLADAFHAGNQKICESVLARGEWRGMGTTIVALLAVGDRVVIGHVGDSRAYLLRNGKLERLTSDHSWVNEQVKLGLLTDDEAHRHPMRNIVTRALGNRADLEVDVSQREVEIGDTFLLCSDGLNSMLGDPVIQTTLGAHRDDPEAACHALVDQANQEGGEDNITVLIVRAGD